MKTRLDHIMLMTILFYLLLLSYFLRAIYPIIQMLKLDVEDEIEYQSMMLSGQLLFGDPDILPQEIRAKLIKFGYFIYGVIIISISQGILREVFQW